MSSDLRQDIVKVPNYTPCTTLGQYQTRFLSAFTPYSDRSAQKTLTTVLHNYLAHLLDLTYGWLVT